MNAMSSSSNPVPTSADTATDTVQAFEGKGYKLGDDSNVVQDTDKSDNESIADYMDVGDDGEYHFEDTYLKDPADFYDDDDECAVVCLKEYHNRKLFNLTVHLSDTLRDEVSYRRSHS